MEVFVVTHFYSSPSMQSEDVVGVFATYELADALRTEKKYEESSFTGLRVEAFDLVTE